MLGEPELAARAQHSPHFGQHLLRIPHRAENQRADHLVD
jgi:hypothetical protein